MNRHICQVDCRKAITLAGYNIVPGMDPDGGEAVDSPILRNTAH